MTRDVTLWKQLNTLVDELSEVTGRDWARFKITNPRTIPGNHGMQSYQLVYVTEYRTKLNGLIERLYGEYFYLEEPPFSGTPSTVISQNQSQSINLQVHLDVASRIETELPHHKEGSKERTFLEKLKSILSTLKDGMEIASAALRLGAELGVDASLIHKIVG